MPVYEGDEDYENPEPTDYPPFDRDTESGHKIANGQKLKKQSRFNFNNKISPFDPLLFELWTQ